MRPAYLPAALPLTLGSPPSVSARRFQAAEKALCATFRCGALAHARFAALCFGGALAPLGSPLRRRSRSARFAASERRSRSRPARRFGAALPLAPGSPLCGDALAPLRSARRFGAALSLRSVRCPLFRRRSRSARFAASVLFCAALVPKLLKK